LQPAKRPTRATPNAAMRRERLPFVGALFGLIFDHVFLQSKDLQRQECK
jgi:hypothetical protein